MYAARFVNILREKHVKYLKTFVICSTTISTLELAKPNAYRVTSKEKNEHSKMNDYTSSSLIDKMW